MENVEPSKFKTPLNIIPLRLLQENPLGNFSTIYLQSCNDRKDINRLPEKKLMHIFNTQTTLS